MAEYHISSSTAIGCRERQWGTLDGEAMTREREGGTGGMRSRRKL